MKTIGLLGGTGWPSTILYYRFLNELVQDRLGRSHSARLLLKSIDYHDIRTDYGQGWRKVPELLKEEMTEFLTHKPDGIILCCNTLHKAYDMIAPSLSITVPFFHAVELTAMAARAASYRKLLLLGTQFTMEDGFFAHGLEQAGLEVVVPQAEERQALQQVQARLAAGSMQLAFRDHFRDLLARYKACDAVVLACTELPLAIDAENSALPILNPTELQCRAAVDFAIA